MALFFKKKSGKTELTNEEIEQLQQQLKQKTEEIKEIYNKLVEAGAVPIPDDLLDDVAGGIYPTAFAICSKGADTPR